MCLTFCSLFQPYLLIIKATFPFSLAFALVMVTGSTLGISLVASVPPDLTKYWTEKQFSLVLWQYLHRVPLFYPKFVLSFSTYYPKFVLSFSTFYPKFLLAFSTFYLPPLTVDIPSFASTASFVFNIAFPPASFILVSALSQIYFLHLASLLLSHIPLHVVFSYYYYLPL